MSSHDSSNHVATYPTVSWRTKEPRPGRFRGLLWAGGIVLLLVALLFGYRTFGTVFVAPAEPTGTPLATATELVPSTSRLALKASLPISVLQQLLNEEAPKRFKGKQDQNLLKQMSNGWIEFDIERGNITMASDGEKLFVGTPLGGRVSAGGILKLPFIGDTPVRGTVDLNAKVTGNLAPALEEDWHLQPNIVANLDIERANLNLANIASIDISSTLERAIEPEIAKILAKLGPELNKESGWKRSLAQIWTDLHRVEKIDREPPFWVSIRPTGVAMSPLDYSDKSQIQAVFGIDVEVVAHLVEPSPPPVQPLSPLMVRQDLSPRSDLQIPAVIPLEVANEHIKQETIEIEVGDSDKIILSQLDLKVLDSNEVLVHADFTATRGLLKRKTEGVLLFRGKPMIDLETQQLAFSNLDFTLETQGILEKSAVWLLKPGLRNELAKALRFDFAKDLGKATESANDAFRQFERPTGLEGNIALENLKVEDVYLIRSGEPSGDAIVVLLGAEAAATLKVGVLKF